MATTSSREVTRLLVAWGDGDRAALDKLIPLVYEELRRLANRYMRREKPGHTLQTSALVNEAYLRLIDQRDVRWQNRAHFFAVSAQLMRRILVDHARGHARVKRGGGAVRVSLDEAAVVSQQKAEEIVALDDALTLLAEFDPRKSRLVELRFFGGLSAEETAEVLAVSTRTVEREWRLVKAWLRRELNRGSNDEA
ncbi:MAG TPA: sigma-70 family RNA polymerase sigma factor [Blastocatellia bacterium]|nr:sigma-70 family RNA polymerase sigma factor [Blastocatellia bacterium]